MADALRRTKRMNGIGLRSLFKKSQSVDFVAALLEALCARKCLQGKANIELPEVAQDQAKMKPAAGSRL